MSGDAGNDTESPLKLEDFKLKEILFNNAAKKLIAMVGHFPASEEDKAVVIVEKVEFDEEIFTTEKEEDSIMKHTALEKIIQNDIYLKCAGLADRKFNKLKVSIIYPATEKHILKYTVQNLHLIVETPEIYEKVTLPYLEKEQFTIDWVYNILEHKQEADKIIYEDDDFILLPDYKWSGQKESLYLLAIVHDRTIKSLRDLNASHLQLLENIQEKSLKTIKEKFDLEASEVRAYFHYQPSFYHLHVHFTYLKFDAPGIFCEKSHLLPTVINNIRLMPDYYQKSSLTFAARELDKLYLAYKEFAGQQKSS